MTDGKIEIETGIDNSGLEKDAKKTQSIISKIGNSDTLKGLSNIGASISGLGVAFKTVSSAAKATKAVMDDLANTYKVQAKAEIQLETAARNNPYLSQSNVRNLKSFASELQGISTVGDEALMPLMAQLAAAGRTQTEIQNIMSAALDASASGAISLESAVQGLNASYSGQVGLLGKQLPMLKNLTAEELKQGKAVEVVAKSYKGMAQEVAAATGTTEQLKNAWGDFKESLGEGVEKFMAPINKALTGVLTKINNIHSAKKELENAYNDIANDKKTTATYDVLIEEAIQKYSAAQEELAAIRKTIAEGAAYSSTFEELAKAETNCRNLSTQLGILQSQRDKLIKQQKEQADLEQKQAEQASKNAQATSHITQNNEELKKQIETIKLKYKLSGEAATTEGQLAQQQEIVNAIEESYINLVQKSNGLVTENNSVAKARLQNLQNEKEKLNAANAELELYNQHLEELDNLSADVQTLLDGLKVEPTKEQEYTAAISASQEYYNKIAQMNDNDLAHFAKNGETKAQLLNQQLEIQAGYQAKLDQLHADDVQKERDRLEQMFNNEVSINESIFETQRKKIEKLKQLEEEYKNSKVHTSEEIKAKCLAIEEEIAQTQISTASKVVDQVSSIVSQISSIGNGITALMRQSAEADKEIALAALEEQYDQGLISLEEYEQKKEEIDKEAAEREYEIALWEWRIKCVEAVASLAKGIMSCIEQGMPLGLINAALTSAAGAVQIATLMANKPIPPSFASGGIVGGKSYTGDNVQANVNSGEMILNAQQQRQLWDTANGNGTNSGLRVIINNSAANVAQVEQPQWNENDLALFIKARVTNDLSNGKYNNALQMANSSMNGQMYSN